MKIFLRERITLQPPILLLKQAQLQMRMLFANCGAATGLAMMTVTMNIPLTIAKKKRKKASQPRQLLAATTTIIGAKTAGTLLLRRI